MSKEEIEKVSISMHRLLQIAITVMLSLVTFWTKEIYSDFKQTKEQVNDHETRITVIEQTEKFYTSNPQKKHEQED